MSIKEQIRDYDAAFNRARSAYGTGAYDDATLEFLFPQLKESEEERIIKTLQEYVKNRNWSLNGPTQDEVLEWLENQNHDGKKWITPAELNRLEALRYEAGFNAGVRSEKEKQKEQKPVDKFQEYLNAPPAERRKMNMDEILGDNKGHQKTPDALTTDSNKEADTSDCKYKNLDDIAQEYVDGVRQYNPEPTWDLMQTAVCYGYHLAEQKEQKPAEWSEEDEKKIHFLSRLIEFQVKDDEYCFGDGSLISKQEAIEMLKSLRPQPKVEWSEEDEKMIRSILFVLESYVSKAECEQSPALTATYPTYYKEIDWLKSLRPQQKEQDVEKYPEDKSFEDERKDYYNNSLVSRQPMNKREIAKHFYWFAKKNAWKPNDDLKKL